MNAETWGMVGAGAVTLAAGVLTFPTRRLTVSEPGSILLLGPLLEAVALAIFAAEHFLGARELMGIVPRWMPGALFWTYFVGVALLAAAMSFIARRYVRWSALLLALFFLLIVCMVDLPVLPRHLHERLFWTLAVRETAFAGGALVLAGSFWPQSRSLGRALIVVGRSAVGCIFVFYAVQHFLFPRNVPGVPLENLTPAWMPAPFALAYFVGFTLLVSGVGLLVPRFCQRSAALAGTVLLLLTVFFYIPIFLTETHSALALEGMNYVGDTLLCASTALLAGFDATLARSLRTYPGQFAHGC